MDELGLDTLLIALAILLLLSAFFSMSETAMIAANRHRLKYLAKNGSGGARRALALLAGTDRLLGVILLANNLVNAGAATLTAYLAGRLFGEGELALAGGTLVITFLILVFSEITPKVIAANYADRLAAKVSYVLVGLLWICTPVVWFVNLFVRLLLALMRLSTKADPAPVMTREELRTLVLEGSRYLPEKHHSILVNLFDLERISVEDLMTPRNQVEALNLAAGPAVLKEQLSTSYHTRLPVFEGQLDTVLGILHVRQVLSLLAAEDLTHEGLRGILRPAYFIPAGTPILTQLQAFQENQQRMGLVVDEYGEILGLVTLEDILEEIIGEFTTTAPSGADDLRRDREGSLLVPGGTTLRVLNRKLGTAFPLDGPRTLNGLLLEHFGDIPEAGVSLRIHDTVLEVVQVQDKAVKVVRLRPPARPGPAMQT
ncbi:hypothetical protein BURK2_03647 [Burkholderiales bacterium]|nr:MAG: HlyC/CorC family transporter [Burkholderiales bacterium]CAG1007792.1 hypothetical protein BURK2_03647 [Burkholderiales bacterium]